VAPRDHQTENRIAEIREVLDSGGPVLGADVRWLLDEHERLQRIIRIYTEARH